METSAHPLAAGIQRGVETRATLLQAEGGVITHKQAAALLDTSLSGLLEMVQRGGKIISLVQPDGQRVYPAWQFDGERRTLLAGLRPILHNLGTHSPWVRASWLLAEQVALNGESPLARLRRRNYRDLSRLARAYGQHGAL